MVHGTAFTLGVLVLALLVYAWAIGRVGRARGKYGVEAPAVTGAPEFERAFRAQQNTVEQIVLFLPLLGLAWYLWGDVWAGVYGIVWCGGRILYIETYSRGMPRTAGFLISAGASFGVLTAIVVTLVVRYVGG